MKITGLVSALNLFTGIPFTEWAWSEAPKDRYGVVTEDGQTELKADADPAAEKMLTGYVDVFIKANDPDPREDVEDAMRFLGVWFRMESIQFEPESGFLHFEWRYVDSMNTARLDILRTLPLLLHVTSAYFDGDGTLYVTFEETAQTIFDAIGERDIGFYVPIDVETPDGITVTQNIFMRIDYQIYERERTVRTAVETKRAHFESFDIDTQKHLAIDVWATQGSVTTEGYYVNTAYQTIVYDDYGVITDPTFTYNQMLGAFMNKTPVYIYYKPEDENNMSILTLSFVGTYEVGGETYYRVCFMGDETGDVWEFSATAPNEVLREV